MTALDGFPDTFDPTGPDADLTIARLVRRLRSLDAKRDRARRIAEAEHAEITAWYQAETAPIEHEAAGLRAVVTEWGQVMRARTGGGTKSWSFPAGTVETEERDHWIYEDETALLGELMAMGQFLRQRAPEIDKVALKKRALVKDGRVLIDGQVIPGVTVERTVTVTVKANGEPETADEDNYENEETEP